MEEQAARGVVASCSYEARKYGVHSAMPMKRALLLCPDAYVLRGDMDYYSMQSRQIKEIIAEDAPLFEQASVDEFYVDVSELDKYFGCWKWSRQLRTKIMRESGLPVSLTAGWFDTRMIWKKKTAFFAP